MKKLVLMILMLGSFWIFAQEQKVRMTGQSYMGDRQTQSGTISLQKFKELIRQPLYARDSTGKEWQVTSFLFTYAERAIYQDSTGTPFIGTDYYSTACNQSLDNMWQQQIADRAKEGDTAFFDRITTVDSSGKNAKMFITEPIKLVLVK